jgi:hypothetical protein
MGFSNPEWPSDYAWNRQIVPRPASALILSGSVTRGCRGAKLETTQREQRVVSLLFNCPKCIATYQIVRHKEPSATVPKCDECGEELPWGDARDWYSYRLLELATRAMAS